MERLSEKLAVVATIDPQTLADTEVFSDVIDMSKYHRVMAIFQTGAMNASTGTLVARACTCDSAGANAAALKTATTVPVTEDVNDNAQVVIEVDEMDLAGGATNKDRYVKFGMVSGATGGPAACVVLGEPKQGLAKDSDLSTVQEIETDLD